MKKEIEVLVNRYGSLDAVAEKLSVKKRTLQYALSGKKKISDHLVKLIKLKAKLVGIEDI